MTKSTILLSFCCVLCLTTAVSATDTAAQADDLEALARALRQQQTPTPTPVGTPPVINQIPEGGVVAQNGNLHHDGVRLPDSPQSLLAYLATFDPRATRVETVLADLCLSLMDGTPSHDVREICLRHLPNQAPSKEK